MTVVLVCLGGVEVHVGCTGGRGLGSHLFIIVGPYQGVRLPVLGGSAGCCGWHVVVSRAGKTKLCIAEDHEARVQLMPASRRDQRLMQLRKRRVGELDELNSV